MEIKMKKITPKTWKERDGGGMDKKDYPSGYINFSDNDDLKNCVIGSKIKIMQEGKVESISENGISYEITKMGAEKIRSPRNAKKKEDY